MDRNNPFQEGDAAMDAASPSNATTEMRNAHLSRVRGASSAPRRGSNVCSDRPDPPSVRGSSARSTSDRSAMTNGLGSEIPMVCGANVLEDDIYSIVARGKNVHRIEGILEGASERIWVTEHTMMKASWVEGDFLLKNPHALLELRREAELIAPSAMAMRAHTKAGIVDLWPDRVKVQGVWTASPKWSMDYSPQRILDDMQEQGFKVQQVSVAECYNRIALRVSVAADQYCKLLRYAKSNQLQIQPVTQAHASVGVVRVGSASPDVYASLNLAIRQAMKLVEQRFDGVCWGDCGEEGGVWSRKFYTNTVLTDKHAWTTVENGIRVSIAARIDGVPLAATLQHVDLKVAEERASYRSPTADEEQAKQHNESFEKQLTDAAGAVKEMLRSWVHLRLSESTACAAASVLLAERNAMQAADLESVKSAHGPFEVAAVGDKPRKRSLGADTDCTEVAALYRTLREALLEAPPAIIPTRPDMRPKKDDRRDAQPAVCTPTTARVRPQNGINHGAAAIEPPAIWPRNQPSAVSLRGRHEADCLQPLPEA